MPRFSRYIFFKTHICTKVSGFFRQANRWQENLNSYYVHTCLLYTQRTFGTSICIQIYDLRYLAGLRRERTCFICFSYWGVLAICIFCWLTDNAYRLVRLVGEKNKHKLTSNEGDGNLPHLSQWGAQAFSGFAGWKRAFTFFFKWNMLNPSTPYFLLLRIFFSRTIHSAYRTKKVLRLPSPRGLRQFFAFFPLSSQNALR